MKIYYEPPEGIDIIEEQLEEVTSAIELHPKLVPVIKPLLDLCRDLFNKRAVCSMELVKYQLMWSLRFLEEEIESENGMFRIRNDGNLAIEDFSGELAEKIRIEIEQRFKK